MGHASISSVSARRAGRAHYATRLSVTDAAPCMGSVTTAPVSASPDGMDNTARCVSRNKSKNKNIFNIFYLTTT